MVLEPYFAAGSGWHRTPGHAMPCSAADLMARDAAAYRCVVFPMRRQGRRLPAFEVLAARPVDGQLVCTQPGGEAWVATFYERGTGEPVLVMAKAQLVRENDGCRLYQGMERDARGTARWPQTWLCTPTAERGREILQEMVNREAGAP